MAWGNVVKTAWSDKFRMPAADELRTGLPKPLQQVFDDARQRLDQLSHVCEYLVWQGVPWRWTFVYLGPQAAEPRTMAYIIPDPSRLQICVPLAHEHVEMISLKRMKKSVRDGVIFARQVNGVWWPTWDVPTVAALDEVFELISRKHTIVTGIESGSPIEV
jgi:hypothetical protein